MVLTPELSTEIPDQSNESFHQMFEMTPEETEALKERIEKWHGLIRVMVHPYFEAFRPIIYEISRGQRKKQEIRKKYIADFIDNYLAKDKEAEPPLIIFEEARSIPYLEKRLASILAQSKNEIYLIPTLDCDPTPLTEPIKPNENPYSSPAKARRWDKLLAFLEKLQIKKTIVGGQYMRLFGSDMMVGDFKIVYDNYKDQRRQKGADQSPSPGQCAGFTAAQLSQKFDVEISGLAAPHARVDFRRIEEQK